MKSAAPADAALERVGRYRLLGVIGEGASGRVYDAVCEATEAEPAEPVVPVGTRIALKLIHQHLVGDRQQSTRFKREARILSQLRGEGLVALLEVGETPEGRLYMALERVQGASLEHLRSEGPLTATRAVTLAVQICEALEQAHALGVVHRDLKPSNVMVEQREQREQVRLLDFGLAKLLHRGAADSLGALTEQDMVFGTPEYMAPEQARGDEIDGRVDVYAVGVIVYELLAGEVPFRGATPIATMTAHLVQPLVPLAARGVAVSPALSAVVSHALARAPEQRYPSLSALAAALRQALAAPEDEAAVRPEGHDPALSDTALALTAPPRAPAPPEPEPAPRLSSLWIVLAVLAALLGVAIGVVMSLVSAL